MEEFVQTFGPDEKVFLKPTRLVGHPSKQGFSHLRENPLSPVVDFLNQRGSGLELNVCMAYCFALWSA